MSTITPNDDNYLNTSSTSTSSTQSIHTNQNHASQSLYQSIVASTSEGSDDSDSVLFVQHQLHQPAFPNMNEQLTNEASPNLKYPQQKPILLDCPFHILAYVLYSLYFYVPGDSRPFHLDSLKRLMSNFLGHNYFQLCNNFLRIIADEDKQSKSLLLQLQTQMRQQQELLNKLNGLMHLINISILILISFFL